jgi:hypothetical protein
VAGLVVFWTESADSSFFLSSVLNVNGHQKARELHGPSENGKSSVGLCKAEQRNRVVTFEWPAMAGDFKEC